MTETILERLFAMTTGSRNVLLVCGTVMFCFIIAASVAIVRIAQDPATALTLVTILFASLATTIAAFASVIKGEATNKVANQNADQLDKVLNGELTATIRKVLGEELVRHSIIEHPSGPTAAGKRPPIHRG